MTSDSSGTRYRSLKEFYPFYLSEHQDTTCRVLHFIGTGLIALWIALAVVWSSASHWVLGVPFDMVMRARRVGGQAEADLEDIARINVSRIASGVPHGGELEFTDQVTIGRALEGRKRL